MVPSPLAVVVVIDAAVGHHHHHAPFRRVPLVAPLRRRRARGRVRGGGVRRGRRSPRGRRPVLAVGRRLVVTMRDYVAEVAVAPGVAELPENNDTT